MFPPFRPLLVRLLGVVLGVLPSSAATNEPVVRMLVPGFSVQELPVKLSNQNNLRFAPDGTLTSLGYDGRVWRLKDTDGDGLEDTAEPFWDQPTLSVPLGMAWSTEGLFVSSKGKVSLLRDTDDDGRADEEVVVTSGWPATDVGSGGVDATAVTLDAAGNLYFGLLGADYSNAYRLRKRGDLKPEEVVWLQQAGRWREPAGPDAANDEFSLYDLNSQRGTIQKFDPRTKKLETIATGLRVPVALAFNQAGDLFNTDQEGETWMPNGNPLDELNHIVAGRNYGFPPRHERWLPDLVSEPPVVSFGPQHQSACGLVFNEPRAKSAEVQSSKLDVAGSFARPAAPAQGLFGPGWWAGDAFVAGESRGKIWRVRLVKTPNGYVGKSYIIARLSMLTLDLAISPRGELYVCCHSGLPDWGTGPQGEGKIFKITYTDPKTPQPVVVWAANPTEVRIAFDRPLDPGVINVRPAIAFGEYVGAGDRFEVLKPPYAVVEQQDATPRGKLAISKVGLGSDGHTLVLTTDPHPLAGNYSLTIPSLSNSFGGFNYDLEYDLHGAAVRFLTGLPNSRFWALKQTLTEIAGGQPTPLEIHDYLLPPGDADLVQPLLRGYQHPLFRLPNGLRDVNEFLFGLRLNIPLGATNLLIQSERLNDLKVWGSSGFLVPTLGDSHSRGEFNLAGVTSRLGIVLSSKLGGSMPAILYRRAGEGFDRNLPLNSTVAIWAPTNRASSGTDSRPPPRPDGDWEHGRELFGVTKLNCVKCHRVRGDGGLAGPDLSNLIHRDPGSVSRDIREPGATLHPDYVTFQAELRNGETRVGFLRGEAAAAIRLFDADGKETAIPRAEIVNLHPTGQSLMPTGLLDGLKETDVRDLLTFLLHEPPVRSRAEVDRVFSHREPGTANPKSLRLVLVASKQDHGPGQHDYPAWQEKWMRLLAATGTNAVVEKAWEWPTEAQFATADVLVFYYWNHDWSVARLAQIDAYQQRGGGVVLLHSATIADRDAEQLAARFGLASQPDRTGYRHMPFELKFVATDHPLTRGLPERLSFLDEPYWPLIGDPAFVRVLATATVDGAERPLVWTFERGRGRVFGSIPGHYFWTLDDPLFRLLVLRGIAWVGGGDLRQFGDAALTEVAVR